MKNITNQEKKKIIYIGGVEHSGSTLLGLLLEQANGIMCAGEISQLPQKAWIDNMSYTCSCGEKISECELWSTIRQHWETNTKASVDLLANSEIIDKNFVFPYVILQKHIQSSGYRKFLSLTENLLITISEDSNKKIIIDTSKRVSRALSLSRLAGVDYKIIHIVRDSRAVAYSSAKEKRAKQRNWVVSSLRWNFINAAFITLYRQLGKERIMRVRYEDLINDPLPTIDSISNFTGVDMLEVKDCIRENKALKPYHITIGNGFIRQGEEIHFSPEEKWREMFPSAIQNHVWHLTSVLMNRFGYQR